VSRVKAEVTFREGRPAADMTRDEVVTWLLGSTGAMGVRPALATFWLVTNAVDGLREGTELEVETRLGLYVLTVTVSGRWYRRVRTYHAEAL
jgi:hypothetical protein